MANAAFTASDERIMVSLTAMKSSPRSSQLEKARAQQQRPDAAKINKLNK